MLQASLGKAFTPAPFIGGSLPLPRVADPVPVWHVVMTRAQLVVRSERQAAPSRPAASRSPPSHNAYGERRGGGRAQVSKIGSRRTRKTSRTPENSGRSGRRPTTQFS